MAVKRFPLPLVFFFIAWLLLCIYSFSQKDLNLTIFDHPALRPFYTIMQSLGYFNRPFSTYIYIALIAILFLCYLLLIFRKKIILSAKKFAVVLVLLLLISLPAQPMFSHDIYNYIFNAKIVLLYQANPHVQVALDYPSDPWLRFMHNVHTPAPYGYGWTALSLIPYSLSNNSFTMAFLLMKLCTSLLFIAEIYVFYKLAFSLFDKKTAWQRTLLLALNPLLLVEVLIIGHNDSAMMLPVLISLYLLVYKTSIPKTIIAWLFWGFSVTTKYASVVLAPFMILHKKIDVFTWGGLSLLTILLTRPGQLHSWYLHWGIVLLMLSKKSWAVSLTILLSIGGLLRYSPYIWFGNWDPPVGSWRWIILIIPLLLLFLKRVRKAFGKMYQV